MTVLADDRYYGKYCGATTGETILVNGNYTVINFHAGSGFYRKDRGFVIQFEAVDPPGNLSNFSVFQNVFQLRKKVSDYLQISRSIETITRVKLNNRL